MCRRGPPLALALEDDYNVALEGDHHRQDAPRSKRTHGRARRRVGDAHIVPYYLSDHHIAEPPRQRHKLTSGSCCARVSSALRVVRPAVVSVVALRVSGTLSVCITTSKEPRAG